MTWVLLLFVIAWLVLPFVPAIHEAVRAHDAGALPISHAYAEDPLAAPGSTPEAESRTVQVGGMHITGTIRLGAGSTVGQRVAGATTLTAEAGTVLLGSTEAEREIVLEPGCRFERVHAPTVRVAVDAEAPARPPRAQGRRQSAPLPEGTEQLAGRALVRSDLHVPEATCLRTNLVVLGDLTVGAGARIEGDVKAHGSVTLEESAAVRGNVFSEEDLTLEAGAHVVGVASADGALRLGAHAWVGRRSAPTTATARRVEVAPGARVHGTLWAQEDGRSVSAPRP